MDKEYKTIMIIDYLLIIYEHEKGKQKQLCKQLPYFLKTKQNSTNSFQKPQQKNQFSSFV